MLTILQNCFTDVSLNTKLPAVPCCAECLCDRQAQDNAVKNNRQSRYCRDIWNIYWSVCLTEVPLLTPSGN